MHLEESAPQMQTSFYKGVMTSLVVVRLANEIAVWIQPLGSVPGKDP